MTQSTIIGLPKQSLLATSAALYGLDQSDQRIYQYQGPINNAWRQIGDAARQFATNWNSLFRLDSNGDVSVFQGDIGQGNQWLLIGTQMSSLVAGGPALYATNSSSGNILRYEGRPFGWTEIGGPGFQFVTNGRRLFGLSPDRQQVNEYTDTPPGWSTVGGPTSWLFIASNALYAVADDNNTLLRYEGAGSWVQVGEGWQKFAALDLSLYAISQDGLTVGQFDGTPGEWTQFAGNATTIAAGFHSLYIGNGEGVFQYDIVTNEDGTGEAAPEAGSPTTRSAHTYQEWIWSFKTSNSYYAGYDGKITMILFSTSPFQQEMKLPRKHFVRGKTYFMKLQIDPDVLPLSGISLTGEENFFDEQWKVDSITAYDPSTLTLYKFRVDKKVPNSESIFIKPRSVEQVHTPPSGYVSVFVWDFMGMDVAWGHASLELSDGTYISWWPEGETPETLPYKAQAEYAATAHDAVPNRTYADDVKGEFDQEPDWHVTVGGLNESAIAKWWKQFKDRNQWSMLSQNCSTTVADAFWAGGANDLLSSTENDGFQSITVWMPADVLAFAQAMIDD